jgi:hypothetical protein
VFLPLRPMVDVDTSFHHDNINRSLGRSFDCRADIQPTSFDFLLYFTRLSVQVKVDDKAGEYEIFP